MIGRGRGGGNEGEDGWRTMASDRSAGVVERIMMQLTKGLIE